MKDAQFGPQFRNHGSAPERLDVVGVRLTDFARCEPYDSNLPSLMAAVTSAIRADAHAGTDGAQGPKPSAPSGPLAIVRHHELLLVASGLALLWGLPYLATHALWSIRHHALSDFGLFYWGTRAWLAGGSFYQQTQGAYGQGAVAAYDLAPPHLHPLFWPFALLDSAPAYLSFIALNFCALVTCVWWTLRATRSTVYLVPALAFILATHAAKGITVGQYTPLLALVATAAWWSLRHGRWTQAAGWIGLLISIKPFALVFTAYVLKRGQWRAAALSLGVAAGIYVVGAAMFGVSSYQAWAGVLGARTAALAVDNPSIASLWARLDMPFVFALASAAAILGVTWWRFDADVDRSMLAGWLAAFLVSPIAWSHYYLLAVGPIITLAVSGRWRWHPLVYLAMAAMPVDLWQIERWHAAVWNQAACAIALLWWIAALTTPSPRADAPSVLRT